jgi:8-oxo-dGTP diphosphatase
MNAEIAIPVSCAIIEKDGLILAALRRHDTSNGAHWEFPGGKIEPDETPQQCLHREIREELGVDIIITGELIPVTHHYPDKTISLYPFICKLAGGSPKALEHETIEWIQPNIRHIRPWSKADLMVWDAYESRIGRLP